ncbi:UDP-N-acetylmuramate--L-alanine ligase [Reichenbachiella sp. MALMAid0571]|uniref:UDP-N-acetylmuramate--L-alanine ligase n=1 Tax=Reichenbachiella sp. MALMAid0571 TaxID=3143939 RepID=UPI0032E051A1
MKLKDIHNVYFIGIGGIGMSALARWFSANGYFVAGYDKTSTPLTKALESEGIAVHSSDSIELIPSSVVSDKSKSLIVYTPAVPKDHQEFNFLKNEGFEILKRSQVLGELTKDNFTIAVAGTHGKTTTSSIIAHILKSSGINCTAFVGGIMTNYNSNLIIGKEGADNVIVVEADEFDRSFLTLHPDIAIITAVDADHLDIYGSAESLKDSFKDFIKNIKRNGKLFIEERSAGKFSIESFEGINVETYGLVNGAIHSNGVSVYKGSFHFDYQRGDKLIRGVKLLLPGFHNTENSIAAISVALDLNVKEDAIKLAIENFKGVKRRFEYIIKSDNLVFIDDYAHHPEEIKALLNSVKALFPNKKITVIFQPHLFTRTRDFADGFSESLSLANEVLLLEIYPARELPIDGVSSSMLLEKITSGQKFVCSKEDLIDKLLRSDLEVVLTVGAGDIDAMVSPIKNALQP